MTIKRVIMDAWESESPARVPWRTEADDLHAYLGMWGICGLLPERTP